MKPPFRADQVGSLLRPAGFAAIRRQGDLEAQRDTIRRIVAKQEAIGLEGITDGELSRDWWHLDFMAQLEGVTVTQNPGPKFGGTEEQPPIPNVTGKLGYSRPIMIEDFSFLKKNTGGTAKFTIPSPSMLHLRAGRAGISREAYPDLKEFWDDAAAAYRAAIAAFAAAGCTYLQLDEVFVAYLCDDNQRQMLRDRGDDPDKLLHVYADLVNAACAGRTPGMTITMHLCRGNFRSTWMAQGGYERVADILFNQMGVDAYFMEYDTDRAGGFEPLRFVPKGKQVVLGLVTSKSGTLESKDALKRRIDEAAKFAPLDQLCLSPQCGFASTEEGNLLAEDEQWAKLRMIVELADEVWGR